jgi:hypothetical protein
MTDQPPLTTHTKHELSARTTQERLSLDALAPLIGSGGCLGKVAATLDIGSMTLIFSDGRQSEADSDKFGYIPDDRNIFLEYVNPGVTDQGHAVFIGAPDPRGFKLALGYADLLSHEHGTVPLSF